MKRFLVAMMMLTLSSVYALPIGNPADPAYLTGSVLNCAQDTYQNSCDPCCWWNQIGFRVGYYGDFVYNRHMKFKGGGKIETTSINTNAGFLALDFMDRLEVFGTVGATNIDLEANVQELGIATSGPVFGAPGWSRSGSDVSWSVGAKAVLWECSGLVWGLEGQYAHANPHVETLTALQPLPLAPLTVYPGSSHTYNYKEWQIGTALSYCVRGIIVPYVGVKYSRAKISTQGGAVPSFPAVASFVANIRSDKHWGWAVGATIYSCDNLSVTVEGRFGDEKALHINGQLRF